MGNSLTGLQGQDSQDRAVSGSGFHAVDSGFQVLDSSICHWNLDSGFQSTELFRIPCAVFLIPQVKIFRISESGFPYN